MSSPAILYMLSGFLFVASLGLILLAERSVWIRRTFGAERMVEDVLETDFYDNSGEFSRPPSRVSDLFLPLPSGNYSTMQPGAPIANRVGPKRDTIAAGNDQSFKSELVGLHGAAPERPNPPS